VISVLCRRWPFGEVVLIPALVQGLEAPRDIMRALSWANAIGDLEVVIVARGGGSAEDLWCFNDEALCRYAADFSLPLISAVGHETDFTLFDFIADVRAATPSAAAEIVAPDVRELHGALFDAQRRLKAAVSNRVLLARERLERLRRSRALSHPHERLKREKDALSQLEKRLQNATSGLVKFEKHKHESLAMRLRALDPQRVLERGYTLLLRADGAVLASASDAQAGEPLRARFHDGEIQVEVSA
jgi:exodeoxyribonuclease VII large subunit